MTQSFSVLLSHPTGNANVRQALSALYEENILHAFWTTVKWSPGSPFDSLLPSKAIAELNRRSYPQVPKQLVHTRPWREAARLLVGRTGLSKLASKITTALSVDSVYRDLDHSVAMRLSRGNVSAVLAYPDGAYESFQSARRNRVHTLYELTSAHVQFANDILSEEAELCPEWADTIARLKDSPEKIAHREEELRLADLVLAPSRHVVMSLPVSLRNNISVCVCPYGAPFPVEIRKEVRNSKLRVLFVGSLTQAKGLGYTLSAIRDVEKLVNFTMIGTRVGKCAELDAALDRYRYIPTLPNSEVLAEMARHDVLVFPSLTEGFGLVIMEALSRGLPVITTENTGGPEIIRDGREGFLVPIRSSQAIAEKLERLARDRDLLEMMSESAIECANNWTWQRYRAQLVSDVKRSCNISGMPSLETTL